MGRYDCCKRKLTTEFDKDLAELRKAGKQEKILSMNDKKYIFGKKLGAGSFGEVYFVKEESTEEFYACKIIDKSKLKDPNYASQELHLMRTLDHENIIKLHDAIEMWGKGVGDIIYLFMEYAIGGDLHNYIAQKPITENDAKLLFRQIVEGVQYLHSKGIAHRDLKPQNILLHFYGIVKIADFGISKSVDYGNCMLSRCGTPRYVAPEVLENKNSGYNGCKADMFSLGIILYDLTTKYGTQKMSSSCEALCRKLTSKDPALRPTATEVLNDPWIVNLSFF